MSSELKRLKFDSALAFLFLFFPWCISNLMGIISHLLSIYVNIAPSRIDMETGSVFWHEAKPTFTPFVAASALRAPHACANVPNTCAKGSCHHTALCLCTDSAVSSFCWDASWLYADDLWRPTVLPFLSSHCWKTMKNKDTRECLSKDTKSYFI